MHRIVWLLKTINSQNMDIRNNKQTMEHSYDWRSLGRLLLQHNPVETISQHKQHFQPSFTFPVYAWCCVNFMNIVMKSILILLIKTSYNEAKSLNMLNPFYFILPEMCWGRLLRQNDSSNNCTLDFVCQGHLTTLQKSIHQLCGFITEEL